MVAAAESSRKMPTSLKEQALEALGELGYTVFKQRVLQTDLSEFQWQGQEHYDKLGRVVLQYIQAVMQEDLGLRRVKVPAPVAERGSKGSGPTSDIFVSTDIRKNKTGLILLIQGSGAVRPGQWARALCINNSLNEGTCLPDIHHARARGWAVAVLNPNESSWTDPSTGQTHYVRGMGGGGHGVQCWDYLLTHSPAKNISIIAHSAGGYVTYQLLSQRPEVLKRARFLALTDAVAGVSRSSTAQLRRFYEKQCFDFVSSAPLDEIRKEYGSIRAWVGKNEVSCCCPPGSDPDPLPTLVHFQANSDGGIVRRRPAGHRKHEWTTAAARFNVWHCIDKFMRAAGALSPRHKAGRGVPKWKQPYAEVVAGAIEAAAAKRAAAAGSGGGLAAAGGGGAGSGRGSGSGTSESVDKVEQEAEGVGMAKGGKEEADGAAKMEGEEEEAEGAAKVEV